MNSDIYTSAKQPPFVANKPLNSLKWANKWTVVNNKVGVFDRLIRFQNKYGRDSGSKHSHNAAGAANPRGKKRPKTGPTNLYCECIFEIFAAALRSSDNCTKSNENISSRNFIGWSRCFITLIPFSSFTHQKTFVSNMCWDVSQSISTSHILFYVLVPEPLSWRKNCQTHLNLVGVYSSICAILSYLLH